MALLAATVCLCSPSVVVAITAPPEIVGPDGDTDTDMTLEMVREPMPNSVKFMEYV